MGSAVSTGKDNDDLVDNLILGSYIKTTQVEEVFRAVDRAYYYLPEHKDNAYHDLAWKNGNLHLSAPCVYCEVMESLELKPGLSFLNIGSGTGYFNTMVGLILGANGTNHGIEMFEDNVKYAEMKLEEFKRTSPSIDAFEFCEPQFVTGNGFCIPFGGQLYDRVYCGAAVPETHASHVQSFLKIGGILVMPYNHHLVQMKRLSVTQYDVSIVLPVSFATLRMPEDSETPQTVTLPDLASVSTLKDACRVVLRRLLRAAVETPRRQPATAAVGGDTRSRKRQLQQVIVAQLCELSDDDDDYGEVGREGLAVNCFPFRVARTVNRRNRVVAGDDGEEEEEDEGLEEERMEDEEEEEKGEEEGGEEEAAAASQSINEQRRKVAKREKFDSGLGEEIDNEKGLTSADEENEEEDNSSSDDSSNERGRNEEKLRGDLMREKLKRKAIMQRLEREREKRNAERITNRNFRGDCSREMRDSIMKLPLPMELKSYLNLYRDF